MQNGYNCGIIDLVRRRQHCRKRQADVPLLLIPLGTRGRGQIWFAFLAEMPPVCGLPCIRRTHSANMRRTSPGLRAVRVLFCYAGQCRQSMALGAIRGPCINVFRLVFSGSDRRVPHGLTSQLEMRGQHLSLFKTTFPLRNRAECRGFLLQGVWGRGGKKHCTKHFLPYCDAATAVTQTVHIPGASEKAPCTGQPKGAKVCVKKFWQSFYPVLHFWH